jgi:hypothetical protein
MKIIWNENPLKTVIEIDERDKERILLFIQNEAYIDILCNLDNAMNGRYSKQEPLTDLEKIKSKIEKWEEICNMTIDCEEIQIIESDLKGSHGGDCTCWPISCMKCYAESALGIDTLKGLGKHEAHAIMGAFGENRTIDDALRHLYKPTERTKLESWAKFSQEDYEKHIPRWEAERERALIWLKNYKEEHGF